MSPDQRGRDPYDGPERRKAHRRMEDLPPVKHGPFTTWQWAVLASFFVNVILSIAVYGLANRADENARRGNAAICVETAFLRNSLSSTERLIRTNPGTAESRARAMSAARLRELIGHLEAEVPNCHEALQ